MITPTPGDHIVWCDTSTCPTGISTRANDHDAAHAAAAAEGWTHTGNLDHCQTCSPPRTPDTPPRR